MKNKPKTHPAGRLGFRGAGVLLSILIVAAVGLYAGRVSRASSASDQWIQAWAPQFMGYCPGSPGVTCGNAAGSHPEKYKLIISFLQSQATIDSWHAQGIKVFMYINGCCSIPKDLGPNGDGSIKTFPESSYMHTAAGERIIIQDFPSNSLMNPRDATWQQSLQKKCQHWMGLANFDGCFYDTMGVAPLSPSYVAPGTPIDPDTGASWTDQTYLEAINAELDMIRGANPGKLIFANALRNGATYYDSTNAISGHLDGAMAELFIKSPTAAPNDTEANWKKNVDMMIDMANKGKTVLVTTKSWESPAATTAQKDIWHKFALATFLLGSSTRSYFSFQYEHTTYSPTTYHPWWDAPIGPPTGAYVHSGNVYLRNFTKGKAVVNPTTTPSTISLGGVYHRVDDNTPITTLTLGARTGEVLIAVPATETATTPTPGATSSKTTSSDTAKTSASSKVAGQAASTNQSAASTTVNAATLPASPRQLVAALAHPLSLRGVMAYLMIMVAVLVGVFAVVFRRRGFNLWKNLLATINRYRNYSTFRRQ